MTLRKTVKERRSCRLVGVIATPADLRLALGLRNPPDLFELRLDSLISMGVEKIARQSSRLRAPLIITARHPAEGGKNQLTGAQRRTLLTRFLSAARYVDVELRAAKSFQSLLDLARRQNVRRIISFHDFESIPRSLHAKAQAAKAAGADIFKVAARTDTVTQLAQLLDFLMKPGVQIAISAMGIGKLGAISRIVAAQAGSALVYASLTKSQVEGQLSLTEIRAAFSALNIS